MTYKRVNWFKYGKNRKNYLIEVLIKEFDGRELDFIRANNKEGYKSISRLLFEKYGIDLSLREKTQQDLDSEVEEERAFLKKEMGFLDKDKSW